MRRIPKRFAGVDELLGGRDHPVIKPKKGCGLVRTGSPVGDFLTATQRYRIIGGGGGSNLTQKERGVGYTEGVGWGRRWHRERGGGGRLLMKRRAFCRTKDCRGVLFGGGGEKKLDF
ncbi:hypothetical protein CEXT_494041 [Caerostris extrusa]|uniref:Uncharacterized protein n=1 Tax=Caerostris extrusa TaxID=172846 RepID=A0AAV4W121_CAEEX|nr:hypothetical protein CEXT_494041 [Caerostris extrusa]